MKAVFSFFGNYREAKLAVNRLLEEGFDLEDMNVIVHDHIVKSQMNPSQKGINVRVTEMDPGLDRLVGGEQPVVLSDIGAVYAAGERATILARAAERDPATELRSILSDLGIEEKKAEIFIRGIKEGGVLFWVMTGEETAGAAVSTLETNSASHVAAYP